jgi:FtsP/CotA-like multicopper oxidase with cupredoxin domain
MTPAGMQNPTLHLQPGDHLVITVTNNTPAGMNLMTLDPPNDFRGRDIGNFVFHRHILNHEDAGMMNIIEVRPATGQVDNAATRKTGFDSAMEISRR